MRIGRRLGLSCGHFTDQEYRDFDFDTKNSPFQYHVFVAPIIRVDHFFCEQCKKPHAITRINAFEVI